MVRRVLGRGSCVYVHVGSVHGVELVAEQDLNESFGAYKGAYSQNKASPAVLYVFDGSGDA